MLENTCLEKLPLTDDCMSPSMITLVKKLRGTSFGSERHENTLLKAAVNFLCLPVVPQATEQ